MGNDPDTSVVDKWSMAHEVPNLAILGGAVFPNSGTHNPTQTIEALAWRTADHIGKHFHAIAQMIWSFKRGMDEAYQVRRLPCWPAARFRSRRTVGAASKVSVKASEFKFSLSKKTVGQGQGYVHRNSLGHVKHDSKINGKKSNTLAAGKLDDVLSGFK